jgi:hypothetical protein
MSRDGARYAAGTAAGAVLVAILAWVFGQLRRASSNPDHDVTQ